MANQNVTGQGVVLPSASKINLPQNATIELTIERVDPENGYTDDGLAIPSERQMAKVAYPSGIYKNHQVADISGLLSQITAFLQARYNVTSFAFDTFPAELGEGAITLKEIVYDA
jgi:hypothetical protein